MMGDNWQLKGTWVEMSNSLDLNSYAHYSFDFWNTIARSNPKFKKKRAEYISLIFDDVISHDEINLAFEKIGGNYNRMVESGIEASHPSVLYQEVLNFLNFKGDIVIGQLVSDLDDLFILYPPIVDVDFVLFLEKIKLLGKTTSITSNTAFISGVIVKRYLHSIDLLKKFDFFIFSDEFGYAKPNEIIFSELIKKAQQFNFGISCSQISHFGDNSLTDIQGALSNGLAAIKIVPASEYQYERFSVYSITNEQLLPFSALEYSRFKYGDISMANKFGIDLFDYFISNHFNLLLDDYETIYVFSSPYSHIPTSSYYLTDFFYKYLSDYKAINTNVSLNVIHGKINRCQTYHEDYGSMNAEQRYDLIKNDTYELITKPTINDLCIFIDDISITGTHQKVVEKLLNESNISPKCIFLYYAILNNDSISPTFENILNYSYVNDLDKLITIISSKSYRITTRTTKYILSLNGLDLSKLLDQFPICNNYAFWDELTRMAKLNRYHDMEVYFENLQLLQLLLRENQLNQLNK